MKWLSIPSLTMLPPRMTAIAVAFDDVNDDLLLVADGCVSDIGEEPECLRSDAIKSARVSRRCAVACAGETWEIGWFLSLLYHCEDLLLRRFDLDVRDVIEERGTVLDDVQNDVVVSRIDAIMGLYRSSSYRDENIHLCVLFAGKTDAGRQSFRWDHDNEWSRADVHGGWIGWPGATDDDAKTVSRIITEARCPADERMKRIMGYCAHRWPGKVSDRLIMRRASRGFDTERVMATPWSCLDEALTPSPKFQSRNGLNAA